MGPVGSGVVDGYLRPDQFLDHLTVIIIQNFKKSHNFHSIVKGRLEPVSLF